MIPQACRFDDMTCSEFLAGPERFERWREGAVDRLYSINDIHERLVCEILEEHPADKARETDLRPAPSDPTFRLSHHANGVVLRCPKGRIAGVYLGLHLAIHPQYRGHGHGRELVIARCLKDGTLPGWDLDPPCYTRLGLTAHRAAWRELQDLPAMTMRERNRYHAILPRENSTELPTRWLARITPHQHKPTTITVSER